MNINRSHAVNSFRQYGHLWYHGAQTLPIDIYKDIIIFHEFIQHATHLAHHSSSQAQAQLIELIQQRDQAYRTQDYDDPDYGWLIEMMYRRRLSNQYIKSFLQSMLLNTTTISYLNEDEQKVYVYGAAEMIGLSVCEIVGCAPSGHAHAQSLAVWLRIIHMLLDLHSDWSRDHHYVPQSILDQYHVNRDDITKSYTTHTIHPPLQDLIKHYVDEHDQLCTHALTWLWYLNPLARPWLLLLLSAYEDIVKSIKHHQYNIFHPHFTHGLIAKITAYIIYRFSRLLWR